MYITAITFSLKTWCIITNANSELSLIGICIIPIPALSQKIRIHGYNIIIISKKGGNFGTLWLGIKIVCLAHLHIIWIVCSKFHLDDLKIVGEVFD